MRHAFLRTLTTPAVARAQATAYGRERVPAPPSGPPQPLGPEERAFIGARDSFYLASVSETGWPYVQHRGGPKGFLCVLDDTHVAFADYRGNRQLISTGNIAVNDRVALFLMDYPARERLKLIGHARHLARHDAAALIARIPSPSGVVIERAFVIELVGFDWNCSQHITPRFTADEVAEAAQPLRDRVAELEAQLANLRGAGKSNGP